MIEVVASNYLYLMMLEDIRKNTKLKKVICKRINLVGFIYNHSLALNLTSKVTNKSGLESQGLLQHTLHCKYCTNKKKILERCPRLNNG